MMRWSPLTAWTLIVLIVGSTALAVAEPVQLEKSVPVAGKRADGAKFSGRVVSYDESGFELRVKPGETETIPWANLDTKTHYVVRKSLIDPKDAAAHIDLGQRMLALDGGKEWSEKAFAIALKLDRNLKPAIDEAKKQATTKPATKPATQPTTDKKIDAGGEKPAMAEQEAVGPRVVGGIEKQFWGPLTPEVQEASIAELKKFAEATQKQLGKSLTLNETDFFLFYSDLEAREAKNWSGVLDRMYAMLAKLFGVDPKTNIWRGKALVFVFRSSTDYYRFQAVMHRTDASNTLGICHTFGNGYVHIGFFRQDAELEFARVLIHESVHGFVHRYKSPARVTSWINEGLADWIATQMLYEKWPNRGKEIRYNAQQFLQQTGGLLGFFDAEHIEGWQYPVAEMMTTFMIEQSKRNYVAFVDGIKDGLTPEDSLKKNKASREKLIQGFSKYIGVRFEK